MRTLILRQVVRNLLPMQVHPALVILQRETPNTMQVLLLEKGLLFSSNPIGHFSFNISLSHIFGFAEYKKVLYGHKHTLTLTRGADTQAKYRANGVPDGKVDITSISWNMPQVQLSPEYLAGMRSLIEQKVTIPISFRARSCEQITLTQTQNYTWRLSVTGGVEKTLIHHHSFSN